MSECMMDFKHAPIWCAACTTIEQSRLALEEQRRANNLKEYELTLEPVVYLKPPKPWVRPMPEPVPAYKPEEKSRTRGGMSIEPRTSQ